MLDQPSSNRDSDRLTVDYGLGYTEPSAGQSLDSTQQQSLLIP